MGQPFKCGDIIFSRGSSPISRIIRHVDGKYSHISIAVSDKTILEAQRFTKTRITPIYFDDYEVVDLGFNDVERDEILKLAVDLTGISYDYTQIMWYFLEYLFNLDRSKIWNNPKNMICSELIAYLLLEMDWFQHIEEIKKVLNSTPNGLYEFLQLEKQFKNKRV